MTGPFRIGIILLALMLGGCGSAGEQANAPRRPVITLLRELAGGDIAAACAVLAPQAVTELRDDFGGSDCPSVVRIVTSYLRSEPSERHAIASARVLRTTDLPFSPAPYRSGSQEERVRVDFYDPVLHRPQALDLSVHRSERGWLVDGGASGLFTLL